MSVASMPKRAARIVVRATRGVSYRREPRLAGAISQGCTFDQVRSPEYVRWCERLKIPPLHHRKTWEWIYIMQVLEDHGMLRAGRRGLGFGVGNEPITPYAALQGAHIVATDLPTSEERAENWRSTGQHARDLTDVNADGLCPDDLFAQRVTFRPVDMRDVPDDLESFDFTWSSCAMEHLGTPEAGLHFFERQLACLKPGGIGVHTTEYDVNPDGPTYSDGMSVLYQRGHLEELIYAMRKQGHDMRITFALGTRPEDLHVDKKPYTNTHLRVDTFGHVHTSFGLVVKRGKR